MHYLWLILVIFNFIIQLAYFFNDKNGSLYLWKKITTPALLFGAILIVLLSPRGIAPLPVLILALMGLGEIGIEGSSVVESREGMSKPPGSGNLAVTLAGILFLLVNLILGAVLLWGRPFFLSIAAATGGFVIFLLLNVFFTWKFEMDGEKMFQTRIYSLGLVVLFAGALCDVIGGLSSLGLAALVLTISDTLVLIRMAVGWDKKTEKGKRLLLFFLIAILLLYYFYMAILINRGNPWP